MNVLFIFLKWGIKYDGSTQSRLPQYFFEPLRTGLNAQAFAKSVLFGFPIKETTATHYVVDLTFFNADAHGVACD